MTETEAIDWLDREFGTDARARLARYVELLVEESERQNLIARSTMSTIWSRHIADSAQLLIFAPTERTTWVDIGAGAGLPGIVIATLSAHSVTLIEPRRLRVDFLRRCGDILDLPNLQVHQRKADNYRAPNAAGVVSARAVAPLATIFADSVGFADDDTRFILPKGVSAESEVAATRRSWHGEFHVKRSIVDPSSGIVIAQGVRPR